MFFTINKLIEFRSVDFEKCRRILQPVQYKRHEMFVPQR